MLTEDVYTIEEVANHLRVPVELIEKEIAAGRLQAMKLAELVRICGADLEAYKTTAKTTLQSTATPIQRNSFMRLEPTHNFFHVWPDGKKEKFSDAQEGVAEYRGTSYRVKLGFTTRDSAGKTRRRGLVLVNRYATVEFVSAGTDTSGLIASIIKDRSGKQLPVGAIVPPEYADLPVGPYQDVVVGPGASNGSAVISSADDFETMVRHALIRYRYREERAEKNE